MYNAPVSGHVTARTIVEENEKARVALHRDMAGQVACLPRAIVGILRTNHLLFLELAHGPGISGQCLSDDEGVDMFRRIFVCRSCDCDRVSSYFRCGINGGRICFSQARSKKMGSFWYGASHLQGGPGVSRALLVLPAYTKYVRSTSYGVLRTCSVRDLLCTIAKPDSVR